MEKREIDFPIYDLSLTGVLYPFILKNLCLILAPFSRADSVRLREMAALLFQERMRKNKGKIKSNKNNKKHQWMCATVEKSGISRRDETRDPVGCERRAL